MCTSEFIQFILFYQHVVYTPNTLSFTLDVLGFLNRRQTDCDWFLPSLCYA